jgi:hypothetical protein
VASSSPPVRKYRLALPSGAVCLVLLLTLLCSAALTAADPASAAPAGATLCVPGGSPPAAIPITQQAKLTATGGDFGDAVAIDGDTLVVGAYGVTVGANSMQGVAYVFVRDGATWTPQATLTASDGAADDYFGRSVAICGDTIVVGARQAKVGTHPYEGAAYVFTRTGTIWTEQARLTAADGAISDSFGQSVAVSGETAVVGASEHADGVGLGQGSVYVFTRSGATWGQQAELTVAGGGLGDAVAIEGNTVVAAAQGVAVAGNSGQGAAYVFTRVGATWSQQARLTATDGESMDQFGSSVALSGGTAVVGAWMDDVGNNSVQGSAYVFVCKGTTWTQQAHLTADDGASGDFAGRSVAVWGDLAVMGSHDHMVGTNAAQGVAYVFSRSGTTWSRQAHLVAADGAQADSFGWSVALSADTAVVGAPVDVNPTTGRGSAYVFEATFPSPPSITSVSPSSGYAGAAVIVGGSGFGVTQGAGRVTFGSTPAAVNWWTDTAIYCTVPSSLLPGSAPAVVRTSRGVSDAQAFTVNAVVPLMPVIGSITPAHALCGATVTVVGSGFGDNQGMSTVTFGGTAAAVTGWSATAITCAVPAGLTPGVADVVVTTSLSSNVAGFHVDGKPSISKISPTRGRVGVTVTIVGKGFGAARGTSKVTFGTKAATRYVFWSDTKIKVRVPSIAKGRKAVRVVTMVGRSNAKYFTRL